MMTTIRIFGLYLYLPVLVLGIVEGLLVASTVIVASLVWYPSELLSHRTADSGVVSVLTAGLLVLVMGSLGLFQIRMREGLSGIFLRVAISFMAVVLVIKFVFLLAPSLTVDSAVAATSIPLAFTAVLLIHAGFFHLVDSEAIKRRVLVLGAGERAAGVAELRRRADRRGFTLVGYVPTPGDANGHVRKEQLINDGRSLKVIVATELIDEIVVALDDRRTGFPMEDLVDFRLAGKRVIDIVDFVEREAGKIRLDLARPGWLVFGDRFSVGYALSLRKRLFDVVIGLAGVIIASPVMLLAAAAIAMESGRPILYRQCRVGQNGQVFDVIKFRSMTTDAEKDGEALWAVKNDSRVTRVGSFLRATRIDEIPQLINVLRGDMSFIGPRPERPEFIDHLSANIPYYNERHRLKPGITGWAQLRYPYGASDADSAQKLQYDFFYLKNGSLFLDLLILLQTVEVVLFGKGAR